MRHILKPKTMKMAMTKPNGKRLRIVIEADVKGIRHLINAEIKKMAKDNFGRDLVFLSTEEI